MSRLCESLYVFIYHFLFYYYYYFLRWNCLPLKIPSSFLFFIFDTRVNAGDARCYLPPVRLDSHSVPVNALKSPPPPFYQVVFRPKHDVLPFFFFSFFLFFAKQKCVLRLQTCLHALSVVSSALSIEKLKKIIF